MDFYFWSLVLAPILGGVLSWGAGRAAIRYWPAWGWLDFPQRYGLQRARKPYPGGLIIFLLSFLVVLWEPLWWWLWVPLALIGGVSFVDDQKPLPVLWRLGVHLIAASLVVLGGIKISVIGWPWAETNLLLPAAVGTLLTIGWVVSLQNAINWFDGLPGLAPGVGALAFLGLASLSFIRPELWQDPSHSGAIITYLFLFGVCGGIWWYFFRGKIVLGDTGSQIIGFLLAVTAIMYGAKLATTMILLTLPLLDTGFSLLRRLYHRQPVWIGDQEHLHHRLSRWVGASRATMLLLLITALLLAGAILTQGMGKWFFWTGSSAILFLLLLGLYAFTKPLRSPQ